MKIFINWVHKKFHQNLDSYTVCPKKDGGLKQKEKKTETDTNKTDTEAFLNGWKDGILMIGTFGFDPLNEEYSVNVEGKEKEVNNDEEVYSVKKRDEKLNPIIVNSFEIELQKKELSSDLDTCISSFDHLIQTVEDAPLLRYIESHEIIKFDNVEEIDNNKKKKRTTLAELFSAESANNVIVKSDPNKENQDSNNKSVFPTKNGLSLGKKLMPRKGEARPGKILNRMVTKMLKKKIHPDLECKVHGNKEGSIMDGSKMTIVNDVSRGYCTHDRAAGRTEVISLLPTQAVVVEE